MLGAAEPDQAAALRRSCCPIVADELALPSGQAWTLKLLRLPADA